MKVRVLAALLLAGAAQAAQPTQDWPCVQVRQPALSVGQMWTATPPTEADAQRARDPALARIADRLAQRRVALEDAQALVDPVPAADRPALFLGVFGRIEREREAILQGISRFGRGQASLAAQVEARRARIAELERAATPDFDAIDAEAEKLDWDERIFIERQAMLTAVCESPVILERRLFDLARRIAPAS